MTWWQVLLSPVEAAILILFPLQSFSYELREGGGETLRTWPGCATASTVASLSQKEAKELALSAAAGVWRQAPRAFL